MMIGICSGCIGHAMIERNKLFLTLCSSILPMGRPWVVMRDLNVILHASEKQGRNTVSWAKGKILRNFLQKTGGLDIDARGSFITWSNGRRACTRSKKDWTG